MGELIIFPLTLRTAPTRKRRKQAEVAVFPHSRRRDLVKKHARAMRGMPAKSERAAYLEEVLEGVCSELAALGIDCRDCQSEELYGLAEAVGKELHGPQFRIQPVQVAQ
jgi:hypothetical protein